MTPFPRITPCRSTWVRYGVCAALHRLGLPARDPHHLHRHRIQVDQEVQLFQWQNHAFPPSRRARLHPQRHPTLLHVPHRIYRRSRAHSLSASGLSKPFIWSSSMQERRTTTSCTSTTSSPCASTACPLPPVSFLDIAITRFWEYGLEVLCVCPPPRTSTR